MTRFVMLDIICTLLILLFVLRCSVRGFVKELMSMAATAFGLIVGAFFYKDVAAFIRTQIMPETKGVPEILGFIVLFVIVFAVVRIVCVMLKGILEQMNLVGVDRFLGAVFGLVEGLAVVSLILFLINIQPVIDREKILSGSIFAERLLPLVSRLPLPRL
ncbi:MAG: CvpA family protein [Treponema sp.]|jgi:membrane protein required for colicin V production|nr:CvpA family protein [Treponema sp.]